MISYYVTLGEPSLAERLQKPLSSPKLDPESNGLPFMGMPSKSVFAQKHNFETETGKKTLK